MGSRRKGRILAFQALYAWDMAVKKDAALDHLLEYTWLEEQAQINLHFSRLLFAGAVENIKIVDREIRKNLINWDFSRLNKVDLALLRLGVYELLFKTAPPKVVIDEAVDISREYGTDDSYKFVNGVLDGVRKSLQPSEMEEKQ